MEEVDMDLTRIYDEMEKGFEILNEEKQAEEMRIKEEKKKIEVLEARILSHLNPALLPFASIIDTKLDRGILFGWIEISIPEFALMTLSTDEEFIQTRYWIHDPKKVRDAIAHDCDWNETYLHRGIRDHRIALALAKQAWENYVKTADGPVEVRAGESHPEAVVYEAVDGEFGSFEIDEGYVQLMIDKRLKHYGLI